MAVSRQCKTRGNRTKTGPPSSGFPILPRRPIILHHRLGPVSVRESDCSRLLLLGAAFTNPKQIQQRLLCSLTKSRIWIPLHPILRILGLPKPALIR